MSVGTPHKPSAPVKPSADTAVPPPGIGTSEAIVPMNMFIDSKVQKLRLPPIADKQADKTKAYMIALSMLPKSGDPENKC